ncbi:MAG: PAS domain S-box protein [Methanoculleaceae archaeon]
MNNELSATIIDVLPDAVFAIDIEGRVTVWNRAMEELTGVPAQEILGKGDFEYAIPFYGERRPVLIDFVISGDEELLSHYYSSSSRKDGMLLGEGDICIRGERRSLRGYASPVHDANGECIGAVEVIHDITGEKEAEEELRRSGEYFRSIIEDQTEFVCRFRPDGTHTFVNRAYADYFGMTPEALTGRIFRPHIHPDDRERLREHFASLTPDHPTATIEQRIIMPDGEVRWQQWNDRAFFDENGRIIEYQSVGRDITDQKRAREALDGYRIQLVQAFELAGMASWIFDTESGVFTFNDRFYALHGTTAEREGGYRMAAEVYIREFVHPDDRHLVLEEIERARSATEPGFLSRFEHRITRRDGKVRNMVVRTGVMVDGNGRPVRMYGVNQDITARKRMEEEFIREKELFEKTFESLRDAAFVLSTKPVTIRMANAAAEEIFGYSREEMVGRNPAFLHVDEPSFKQFIDRLSSAVSKNKLIPRFQHPMKRKGGSVFPAEHTVTPIYDQDDENTVWIALLRDLTPLMEMRRREQEAIRQIEENMEQLATLNDQIRNPLSVIVGLVELNCPGAREEIMEQVERIDGIVSMLDAGWIRSEKTWEFLRRHYGIGEGREGHPWGDMEAME